MVIPQCYATVAGNAVAYPLCACARSRDARGSDASDPRAPNFPYSCGHRACSALSPQSRVCLSCACGSEASEPRVSILRIHVPAGHVRLWRLRAARAKFARSRGHRACAALSPQSRVCLSCACGSGVSEPHEAILGIDADAALDLRRKRRISSAEIRGSEVGEGIARPRAGAPTLARLALDVVISPLRDDGGSGQDLHLGVRPRHDLHVHADGDGRQGDVLAGGGGDVVDVVGDPVPPHPRVGYRDDGRHGGRLGGGVRRT